MAAITNQTAMTEMRDRNNYFKNLLMTNIEKKISEVTAEEIQKECDRCKCDKATALNNITKDIRIEEKDKINCVLLPESSDL